jgi:hypothetical protein
MMEHVVAFMLGVAVALSTGMLVRYVWWRWRVRR